MLFSSLVSQVKQYGVFEQYGVKYRQEDEIRNKNTTKPQSRGKSLPTRVTLHPMKAQLKEFVKRFFLIHLDIVNAHLQSFIGRLELNCQYHPTKEEHTKEKQSLKIL